MEHSGQMDKEFLEEVRMQFINNPHLDSAKLMSFCQEHKISLRDFSSIMYHLLCDFLCHGESMEHPTEYDPNQLAMGIKVEMEHTINPMISEKIAKDHLSEIPDYYTRLYVMETGAGVR